MVACGLAAMMGVEPQQSDNHPSPSSSSSSSRKSTAGTASGAKPLPASSASAPSTTMNTARAESPPMSARKAALMKRFENQSTPTRKKRHAHDGAPGPTSASSASSNRKAVLRHELKAWEKQFEREHKRKPCREDIKQQPSIRECLFQCACVYLCVLVSLCACVILNQFHPTHRWPLVDRAQIQGVSPPQVRVEESDSPPPTRSGCP